jgi:hypothetical protein
LKSTRFWRKALEILLSAFGSGIPYFSAELRFKVKSPQLAAGALFDSQERSGTKKDPGNFWNNLESWN